MHRYALALLEVGEFHNHIKDIEASIKFTIENETNNFIPFLNVSVTRKASGGLMTNVYQKPTHTNRYLNFYSAHSMNQKQDLVKLFKCLTYCRKELNHS